MPKFDSKEGQWFPAKEKVAIVNKDGEPEIYEGFDREAMKMLKEIGQPIPSEEDDEVFVMGQHFTDDPQMYELARSKHYDSVEDYVEKMGYNKEKALKIWKEHQDRVNTHKAPEKKKDKVVSAGGIDTASGKQVDKGGFGEHGENLK